MYGTSIGTLNVFAKRNDSSSGELGILIWTRSGSQGNNWYQAAITLNYASPYEVRAYLVLCICSETVFFWKKTLINICS